MKVEVPEGRTFTEGENLQFAGIPSFAPELFRRVQFRDPLKLKALTKGLTQLSEEDATQFFRPLIGTRPSAALARSA